MCIYIVVYAQIRSRGRCVARVFGWDIGQSSKERMKRINKKQTNGHRVKQMVTESQLAGRQLASSLPGEEAIVKRRTSDHC